MQTATDQPNRTSFNSLYCSEIRGSNVLARCHASTAIRRMPGMGSRATVYRWDDVALEKVTEMMSRKLVTGERQMLAQTYLKRGALVPMHAHDSEQMIYVLQGGRIAEAGTHWELLARNGLYARLWSLQASAAPEELPVSEPVGAKV